MEAGFYSAIRREEPIRTFNDWKDQPPGYCEIDMVAHVACRSPVRSIQTLTMVDVATGWTECMPLVVRECARSSCRRSSEHRACSPWLIVEADFDNDSAFMNDVVAPC